VYHQTQTQTAAPGELVVMLYRGAARFVARGIEAVENQEVETAHNSFVRAQAIITELLETLDLERGGELARNLMRIYEYLHFRLVQANLHKDVVPAREVAQLLHELLPAWEAAVRETQASTRPMVAAAR
jgi:flagellar protein FliS